MVADVALDEKFVSKANDFFKNYDPLYDDHLAGPQLNALSEAFLDEYSDYMEKLEPCVRIIEVGTNKDVTKYPNGNILDIIAEDEKILHGDPSVVYKQTNYSDLICGLYWRFAGARYLFLTYEISEGRDCDRKQTIVLARRAFRMNPNVFETLVWMMLSTGLTIENMPISRTQAAHAQLLRDLIEQVIKLQPNNFLGHHMLGRYFCTQSQLTWVERSLGKAFTNVKLDGTFDKAEAALLKSDQLRPNWVPNGYWLARIKVAQKRPVEEIKPWIDMGLNNKVTEPWGFIERNELLKIKQKLKLQ